LAYQINRLRGDHGVWQGLVRERADQMVAQNLLLLHTIRQRKDLLEKSSVQQKLDLARAKTD
jgi:hypothetical protein